MKLEAFLYQLMRDELPAGTIERLVVEAQDCAGNEDSHFSNRGLLAYCKDVAGRLR